MDAFFYNFFVVVVRSGISHMYRRQLCVRQWVFLRSREVMHLLYDDDCEPVSGKTRNTRTPRTLTKLYHKTITTKRCERKKCVCTLFCSLLRRRRRCCRLFYEYLHAILLDRLSLSDTCFDEQLLSVSLHKKQRQKNALFIYAL